MGPKKLSRNKQNKKPKQLENTNLKKLLLLLLLRKT